MGPISVTAIDAIRCLVQSHLSIPVRPRAVGRGRVRLAAGGSVWVRTNPEQAVLRSSTPEYHRGTTRDADGVSAGVPASAGRRGREPAATDRPVRRARTPP